RPASGGRSGRVRDIAEHILAVVGRVEPEEAPCGAVLVELEVVAVTRRQEQPSACPRPGRHTPHDQPGRTGRGPGRGATTTAVRGAGSRAEVGLTVPAAHRIRFDVLLAKRADPAVSGGLR